jgi:hypothetical protein
MTKRSDIKLEVHSMTDGLQYHFSNYCKLNESLVHYDPNTDKHHLEDAQTINKMKHEVIAYFNRMGQFYYFAISNTVKEIIPSAKEMMPTIIHFMPFRHKQSAHRATDQPKNEKKEYMEQLNRLFSYQYLLVGKRLWFQILSDNKEDRRDFDLIEEHHKILLEAKAILTSI